MLFQHGEPLPDKGKLTARWGRKATDQATGLMAGLPKEGRRNLAWEMVVLRLTGGPLWVLLSRPASREQHDAPPLASRCSRSLPVPSSPPATTSTRCSRPPAS